MLNGVEAENAKTGYSTSGQFVLTRALIAIQ